jgi:hypothetical protein
MAREAMSFRAWTTGFEDLDVTLLDLRFSPDGDLSFDLGLASSGGSDRPVFRGQARDAAFRVQDESGLVGLWQALSGSTQRGKASFAYRGGLWTQESPLTFHHGGGWAYVIVTGDSCLEIVAAEAPTIERL